MISRLAQREQCEGCCRLARCDNERAGDSDCCRAATFESVDSLFQRSLRWVHDAGVDVPNLSQAKQVGGMLGVTELIRRCLVDRYSAGT